MLSKWVYLAAYREYQRLKQLYIFGLDLSELVCYTLLHLIGSPVFNGKPGQRRLKRADEKIGNSGTHSCAD
jgi:hypothetical protein